MTGAVMAASALSGGLKVTVAPNPTVGSGTQTGFAGAFVENYVLPVSYSWGFQGGDDLVALTPSSPSTRFGGTPPSGEVYVASYNCTVVDATGATVTSENISVRLTG